MASSVEAILEGAYDPALVRALFAAYSDTLKAFHAGRWKPSELDAGHFVEMARRLLEVELFQVVLPIGKALPKFNEKELARYEATLADEAFRILMPRVLYAMYCVRNKRGVGHVGLVSPNEMDAALLVGSAKWVLAEFVRQKSNLTPAETHALVGGIIAREVPVIWKGAKTRRVLASGLTAQEEVMLHLHEAGSLTVEELRAAVEYKNPTTFKAKVLKLHRARMIEFDPSDGVCQILPPGIKYAENLLQSLD